VDDIPLPWQFAALGVLFVLSGFFAMAETAMMAVNRHKLRAQADAGHRGAALAQALLGQVDRLISMILIFNTLINAAAAMLTGHIALDVLGKEKWTLEAGTLFVTFCLLVFSEITPKVAGATYPEWLTPRISYLLTPLLRIAYPAIWFVNLFVGALLRLFRLKREPGHEESPLSPDELRALVLESGHFIPQRHQGILVNLFDLERVTVEDIMTPRGEIEAIDIQAPIETIRQQLATSYHTRLPVFDGEPGNVVGVLHQRRLLSGILGGEFAHAPLLEQLAAPYFIPAATQVYDQLRYFQENRQRLGLVVDEYGEIEGLVTVEDIIEEIIGKFTTSLPEGGELSWGADGSVLVDGSRSLREINRHLGLSLPLDGPKTLNGLLLEHLQEIPDSEVSVRIADVHMEIVHTQDRKVRGVKIYRPDEAPGM
jgi:Mg2+/Co2+ transporter CorB